VRAAEASLRELDNSMNPTTAAPSTAAFVGDLRPNAATIVIMHALAAITSRRIAVTCSAATTRDSAA